MAQIDVYVEKALIKGYWLGFRSCRFFLSDNPTLYFTAASFFTAAFANNVTWSIQRFPVTFSTEWWRTFNSSLIKH